MAEVTRRHRELAFKVLGHSTDVNSYAECGRTLVKNWLERGIDGGPPMFEQESLCARVIADIEAEALAQVPRWIVCAERMPEPDVAVLIIGHAWASPFVAKLILDAVDGKPSCWSDSDGNGDVIYLDDVTHWMPLPSPPETK